MYFCHFTYITKLGHYKIKIKKKKKRKENRTRDYYRYTTHSELSYSSIQESILQSPSDFLPYTPHLQFLSHLTFRSLFSHFCIYKTQSLNTQFSDFSMATVPQSIAISSLSNRTQSLPPALTSSPSLSLSVCRKPGSFAGFSGLRIQLPSSRSVSSFTSRKPRALRPSGQIVCEAQDTALDGKFVARNFFYLLNSYSNSWTCFG